MKYDYFKVNYCETRAYAKSTNLFMPSSDDDTNNIEEMWNNICSGLKTIRNKFIKLKAKNKYRNKMSNEKGKI